MYSPQISCIIPHYPLPGTREVLQRCVQSLRGRGATEIIIVSNDGDGYGKAVNFGLTLASGDYLCVVNNDTEVQTGFLSWLCFEDRLAVPEIVPPARDNNPRCFFCMPRSIYNEVKNFHSDDFFDEQFYPGYFEDDDLIKRLELLEIQTEYVANVVVSHANGGGLTMKQLGEHDSFNINKKRFEKKWK